MVSRIISRLGFIEPQLPTLVDEPPEGFDWIHEVKYDGYRTQIHVDKWGVLAFTRRGLNWTAKYPGIVAAARHLSCKSAILDGEVILPNEAGGSFSGFRSALARRPQDLVFVAFDLIHLNGRDIRAERLLDRKDALWKLIEPAEGAIQFSGHVSGGGGAFYRAVDRMSLEGMVSKRGSSAYVSGASRSWLKIKCYEETDYEIAGVQRERGKPAMALMVDADRNYVGSAFITLNREMRERLWARVQKKAGPVPKGIEKGKVAEWLKPGTIGRVRHLKSEEKLRHATLKDFRHG